MEDELAEILSNISTKIGKINDAYKIESTTNRVYLIKNGRKYILKIYTDAGVSEDKDIQIIPRFGNFNGVMKKIHFVGKHAGRRFSVSEYIEGKKLSEVIYQKNPKEYVKQLTRFFNNCKKIKMRGFGRLNSEFEGIHPTWESFILKLEGDLFSRTQSLKLLDEKEKEAIKQKTKRILNNKKIKPTLVPVDLNLSNFIIDKKNQLRVIDIGSWFSGDPEFAYGLMLMHAWKTPLHKQLIANKQKEKLISYSFLESLSILAFNQKQQRGGIESLKPFGNKSRVLDILEEQKKELINA